MLKKLLNWQWKDIQDKRSAKREKGVEAYENQWISDFVVSSAHVL